MSSCEDTSIKSRNFLGKLLLFSVFLSTIITLFGGALYFFQNGTNEPHYEKFSFEAKNTMNIFSILNGIRNFDGVSFLQLGILLLIFTPIILVTSSIFIFLFEKDRMYAIFSAIILLILLLSFFN